jgi:hypothetical protein
MRLPVLVVLVCAGGCAADTATSSQQRDEGTVVTGSRIPVRSGTVQPTGSMNGDDYRDSQRGVGTQGKPNG